MAGWPRGGSHAFLVQADHVLAVGLEHVAVVRLRPGGLREPPDVFDRVPDADALDRHPFGGHGHLRGVEPEAFLGQVKAQFLDEDHLICGSTVRLEKRKPQLNSHVLT